MAHVFISFGEEDVSFARELSSRITDSLGLDTWMFTKDLVTGTRWAEVIDEAIESCSTLVLIVSPDANHSMFVTYEWSYALGCGIPVLAIFLQDTEPHPKLTKVLQYIDFRTERRWDQFIEDLRRAVDTHEARRLRIPRQATNSVKRAAAALEDHLRDTRDEAVQSLAQIAAKDSTACDVLAEAVHKLPYEDTSIVAALALADLKDRRCIYGLNLALQHKYRNWEEAYGRAVRAAGEFKERSLLPNLIAAVGEARFNMIAPIAWSIGEIGDPSSIPVLIDILTTRTQEARAAAAEALGKMKAHEAISQLINTLTNPNYRFQTEMRAGREKAAWALGQLGTDEAVEGLEQAILDPDIPIREAVVSALGDSGNPNALQSLVEALTDSNTNIRATAAVGLGLLRDTGAVAHLIPRLKDTEKVSAIRRSDILKPARVCDAIAWALEQINTVEARDALNNWSRRQPISQ